MVLTLLVAFQLVSVCGSVDHGNPVVQTPRGTLMGRYEISRNGSLFETYWGIRYGHVSRRFEQSIPSGSWDGIKYALTPSPACAQFSLKPGNLTTGVEDCLYLNVFTPKSDDKKRAVLVYVHGGGFTVGSTLEYGGKYLVDEDLVIVTLNYRLGILGFLNTQDEAVTGNNGLRDQVLALKWVQENIESFGGDRNHVTIAGNSAGGASVLHLLLSPMARGLFHGVYSQSGSPVNHWAFQETIKPVIQVMSQYLGCDTQDNVKVVDCFRKASLDNLILAQHSTARWPYDLFRTSPSIERRTSVDEELFMEKSPKERIIEGKFPRIPILLTIVKDEGALILGSVVIRNEAFLKSLNENATQLDPMVFGFQKFSKLISRAEISKQMRDFYFGEQVIQKEDEQKLVDLFSDTWFISGIRNAAKLLGTYTPVYLGLFTHKRNDSFSPVSGLGVTEKVELVSHCEELAYMFNPTGEPNPFPHIGSGGFGDPRDIEFSKEFVKMLASFIKTGTPRVPFGDKPLWNPISKAEIDSDSLKFLNLGNVPYVHNNPFQKRHEFWKNLIKPCRESENDEL